MLKLFKGFVLSLFILIGIGLSQSAYTQVTKLRGKVVDAKTQEPLPFVNIAFKGTTIGTTTDFDGNYFLETRTPTDSLHVSFVGYTQRVYKVQKGVFQTLNIELHSETVALNEIKVIFVGNGRVGKTTISKNTVVTLLC